MTDTTVTTAAPAATATTATATSNTNVFEAAVNSLISKIESDFEWVEADAIQLCQAIYDGAEIAVEDLQGALGFLGTLAANTATTVTAINTGVSTLNAAGVQLPTELTTGLTDVANAAAGVTAALSDQAVAANASKAFTSGYDAIKVLQQTAGVTAAILAKIPATTSTSATAASS